MKGEGKRYFTKEGEKVFVSRINLFLLAVFLGYHGGLLSRDISSQKNNQQKEREHLFKGLEEKAAATKKALRQSVSIEKDADQKVAHFSNGSSNNALRMNQPLRAPEDSIVFGDYVILGDKTGFGHLYTTSDLSYSHYLYTTTDLTTTQTIYSGTKVVALTATTNGDYDVRDHVWRIMPAPASSKNIGDTVTRGDIIEIYAARTGFYLAENEQEAPIYLVGCQVFGSSEQSELTSWLITEVALSSSGEITPGDNGIILLNGRSRRLLAAANRVDASLGDRYPVITRSVTVARRKRDMNPLFYVVRKATQQEIDDAIAG